MKKLLHLQLLPLMSGVQRFSLYLLDGLDKNEFEIYVACKPGGEFVTAIQAAGYHYLPLPSFRHPISPCDPLTFLHLLWLFKKHRFDIVHTHSSKPGLLGRLAARLCKVPLIVHTAHGTAFQESQKPLTYKLFTLLEAWGNRLGHKTVFVNNSDRLKCLELGLLTEKQASTVFNALPDQQDEALEYISNARKIPEQDIIVGSTLRFSDQKNVISLIRAACMACHQAPNLRFIILGDGDHYSLCRAIVQTNGLGERILLPGWDSEVIPWLKIFHAFVLYSRWEAMPFSVIEAMFSGLPVIGSAIPSISELVDPETGYLVPLDAEQQLADTLIQLANDFAPAFQKGKKAHTRIKKLCNYHAMVRSYRDIYLADPA